MMTQVHQTLSFGAQGMVAQDQRSVEIYRRQGDINWTYQAFTDDEAVTLSSVGLTLAMASIYNPS